MPGRPGCHCRSCDAGVPHKLVKDYTPSERAELEATIGRAFGELHVLPVAATPPEARRFGGNTRQPWTPRPARTAA